MNSRGRFSWRINQLEVKSEKWRPPRFEPAPASFAQDIAARARRFADLQAASIWADLRKTLPQWEGTVVDVGCGSQPYRGLFGAEVKYIGIDTADALEHFGYSVPDTLYFSGDVWPIADASVDGLLATETLEHVSNPAQFLAEAHRVLKPGGQILLTVPFSARFHFIPHDYWRFTPSALEQLLLAAGFVNLGVYARGNAWTVACYKAMALLLPLLFPRGRTPLQTIALQLIALPFLPAFVLLAAIAQLSLLGRGGDDCLGYTATAERAAQ